MSEQLKESDPPKVVAMAALDEKDPLCSDALTLFVSLLGGVCGNLALTGLTLGGLYLGGRYTAPNSIRAEKRCFS